MKRISLSVWGVAILLLLSLTAFAAVPNWAPNTTYATGALVMFNGVEYQCIQAHTSEVGWEPPVVPALWQPVSGTPAPTPTPTATPNPTATPGGTPTPTPKPSSTPTPTPKPTATPKPTPTPTPGGGGSGTTRTGVYITFYGWPDNSPPGNAIAYPGTFHNVATTGGSRANPSTYASDAKDGEFAVGTIIYVPFLKKYFVNEDECTGSGPPIAGTGNCEADWEKKHQYHVDLWLGGKGVNTNTVLNCEDSLTGFGTIIVNPDSNRPVDTTPILSSSGVCEKLSPF